MNECLLSIIVPVYNVEKYLYECYESIRNQITQECEVILVDDGSTDSSGAICDSICNSDPRVCVIHKDNGGLSDARNEGIRHSTGRYIMFLDSDDKISPDSIKEIIDNINTYHTDILMGRTKVFSSSDTNNEKYNISSYSDYQSIEDPCTVFIELDKKAGFWFAAWLVIIRKDYLLQNKLFFEKGILHEDERWVPLVFANAESVKLFDKAFYLYRTNREGSIVSAPKIKREFDKLDTAELFHGYRTRTLKGMDLLKRRASALVFGTVLSLKYYRNNDDYKKLIRAIRTKIPIMYYGKYKPVAIFCKIMGVRLTSRLICLLVK